MCIRSSTPGSTPIGVRNEFRFPPSALYDESPWRWPLPRRKKNEIQFDAAYQQIDHFIQRYMREWTTLGLAVAITDRQKLLRLRLCGFSMPRRALQ